MRRTISSRSRSAASTAPQVLDAIRARVRGTRGRAARGATRRPEPPQRELRAARARAPVRARFASSSPIRASRSPTPTRRYLDLLAFVLGNGESSRLVRAVKERDALVDRIDAWSYTPLDPGTTAIDFDADTRARRGRARGDASPRSSGCARSPCRADELEKARTNFLASEHFERESVSGLARSSAASSCSGGGLDAEARYLEAIAQATPDDLLRVARAWLATRGAHRRRAAARVADVGAVDAAAIGARSTRGVERARARDVARRGPLARARARRAMRCGRRRAARAAAPQRARGRGARRAARRAARRGRERRRAHRVPRLDVAARHREPLGGRRSRARSRAAPPTSTCFAGRSSFGLTLEAPSAALEPALDLFAEVLRRARLRPRRARARARGDARRDRAPRGPARAARVPAVRRAALPRASRTACRRSAAPR